MIFPDETTLQSIVALACRAPSVHNTQPWLWVVRNHTLNLYADTRRQLMYADHSRRDLVISCGAALHHVEVAAAAAGWSCRVDRVPDRDDPTFLAAMSFKPRTPRADDLRLAGAITQRHTDRRQLSSWPVPASRVEQLIHLAGRLGTLATPVPDELHEVVFDALTVASNLQSRNDAYLDELLAWTHVREAEGVPTSSLLTRAASERLPGSFTRFPTGSLGDKSSEEALAAATWLVLSTSSDDVLSRLRTGEALSAIWLGCTVAGLSLVPFTQPIEVDQTRESLQSRLLNGQSCAQIVLRLGWPPLSHQPVPPTPRRPVELVLEFQTPPS